MITVTVRTDRYFFASIGAFQTIFTAQYDCLVFVTATLGASSGLSKLTPPDSIIILTSPTNSTIARFGNSVFMKSGESIAGGNLSSLTLYVTKVD
jgi:hypothetical protein